MLTTPHPHARAFAVTAAGTLALLLGSATPACSSSNAAPPSTSTNSTTATGGSSTTSSTSTTSTTTGSTSTTSTGTGGGDGGSGGDGGDAGLPTCVPTQDGGCYTCPQTSSQFLNQCAPSGDQCTHFDNASRLPFWDGGALPPAP